MISIVKTPNLTKELEDKFFNKKVLKVYENRNNTIQSIIWRGELIDDDFEFQILYLMGFISIDLTDRPMMLGKNTTIIASNENIKDLVKVGFENKLNRITQICSRLTSPKDFESFTFDVICNLLNWKKDDNFKFEEMDFS